MSSYRGYYSSRDDVSGSTARFGSMASPAAYRPSYSGGTYRSVKRDNITPTPYVNRFGSTAAITKDEKDKSTESITKTPSTQQKYTGNTSNKENASNHKISRFSTSATNLSRYGRKSRDPSPATDRRTNVITRVRSREPSPAMSSLRGRSRDPSPSDMMVKSKLNPPSTSYTPSYRLSSRISSGLSSTRLGTNSSLPRSTDTALSYMSSSDARARSVKRQLDSRTKKNQERNSTSESSSAKDLSVTDKSQGVRSTENEPDVFMSVNVVTRATSPTPPGATTFSHTRRIEIAKTVERTIQRNTRRPAGVDKEIQSDRLDDSTRYSRFSGAARASSGIPWNSNIENKYSNNSARYSSSSPGSVKVSRDTPSKSETDVSEGNNKVTVSLSLSKSSSSRSMKSEKSKNSSDSKGKTTGSKQLPTLSKQNSSSTPARSLPPTVPKPESPVKTTSSSNGSIKWANKDFRKSALNIGPTDRPRKSRTPSTGTDTEDKPEQTKSSNPNLPNQLLNRIERSPSVGSEASNVSTSPSTSSSSSENDSKGRHQRKIKASPGKHQTKACLGDESSSVSYNKNICDSSGHHSVQDSSGIQENKQQKQQQQQQQPLCKMNRNLSKRTSPVDSSGSKIDDAKSFLIRKLGSVSNFLVARAQDTSGETFYLDNSSGNSISDGVKQDVTIAATVSLSNPITTATISNQKKSCNKTESDLDDSSWWLDTSQQIDTESALDVKDGMKYKLRHIDSGEAAWWMRNDNDDTIAENLNSLNENDQDKSENTEKCYYNEESADCADKSWWTNENDENSSKNKTKNKFSRSDSGEHPWWLGDTTTDDCNNEQHVEDQQETNEKSWWPRENISADYNKNNSQKSTTSPIKNCEPPWMKEKSATNGDADETPWWINTEESKEQNHNEQYNESSPPKNGSATLEERSWWTSGPTKKLSNLRTIESGERAWWLEDDPLEKSPKKQNENAKEDSSDDEEVQNCNYSRVSEKCLQEHLPLGDRASPEGLEDPTKIRKSPYTNIPYQKNQIEAKQKFFISRHTNIDELLGGSCHPLSPLMDRFAGKNMFLEEITPAQVRIHDSTAKMPFIQRIDRDECDFTPKTCERHYNRNQSEVSI